MNTTTTDIDTLRALSPGLAGYSDEAIHEVLERIKAARRAEHRAKQQMGIKRKLASGEGYGAAPVGYINRRVGDRAWIEPDPVTFPLIQEARQLHATGRYSLRQLCAVMAEKGLRSRNGKVVGPSAMWWMLKSPPDIS
jgi:hypothetical protein